MIDVPSGHQLTVGCTATGNPRPTVSWLNNNNRPISESAGRVRVLGDGSLQIANFDSRDAGRYNCRASNSEGSDQEYINVREAGAD